MRLVHSRYAAILAAAAACSAPALAQAPPDPRAGERLARQWCASCHLVATDQATPAPDTAPTFASIAARPSITANALRVMIQLPYPRMPQLPLTRQEVEHIIAYIVSLQRR